jgi:hypothetical protein
MTAYPGSVGMERAKPITWAAGDRDARGAILLEAESRAHAHAVALAQTGTCLTPDMPARSIIRPLPHVPRGRRPPWAVRSHRQAWRRWTAFALRATRLR